MSTFLDMNSSMNLGQVLCNHTGNFVSISEIAGDIFGDPLLLVPGVADTKVLAPAYEVVCDCVIATVVSVTLVLCPLLAE